MPSLRIRFIPRLHWLLLRRRYFQLWLLQIRLVLDWRYPHASVTNPGVMSEEGCHLVVRRMHLTNFTNNKSDTFISTKKSDLKLWDVFNSVKSLRKMQEQKLNFIFARKNTSILPITHKITILTTRYKYDLFPGKSQNSKKFHNKN